MKLMSRHGVKKGYPFWFGEHVECVKLTIINGSLRDSKEKEHSLRQDIMMSREMGKAILCFIVIKTKQAVCSLIVFLSVHGNKH